MVSKLLRGMIYKLLAEVSPDIASAMREEDPDGYEAWELLPDPMGVILMWEELQARTRREPIRMPSMVLVGKPRPIKKPVVFSKYEELITEGKGDKKKAKKILKSL